jgi:cytochrome c biogenesis protein
MTENKKQSGTGVEETDFSTGEKEASKSEASIVNKVWDFFSSMKLGIVLIMVLALVSIVGTVWIPTDPNTGEQDFTVFYNNIFFRMLMVLLALNLLVCSLNRWKSVMSTFKGPNVDISENFIKNLKSGSSVKLKASPGAIADTIKELLRKKGYRVFTKQDGEVAKIASDKGHWGILGPYLTHISFIVIIIAVIIKFSGLVGFEGQLAMVPGQTANVSEVQGIENVDPSEYFDLYLKDFRTEFRDDGSVKQWYSDVTVIDGTDKYDYSIYVNNPLVHRSIKFYQMSYGYQFNGTWSGPSQKDQPLTIGMQQQVQIPGTDITFIPASYDEKAKMLDVDVYQGNQSLGCQAVALNTPFKYGQAEIKFNQAQGYTVLSVKRDPGVPIIGTGSILLIVGVIFSFILRQRRIWAVVSPDKDGSVVQIGGISGKDKRSMDVDLEDILSGLKN